MTSTIPRSKLPPGPSAQGAPSPLPSLEESFPNSTKVYVEGPGQVRVPMREIALSGGEPPLRVYDTSGPQGFDVSDGLPALRRPWVLERDVEVRNTVLAPSLATRAQGDNVVADPLTRRPAVETATAG